MGWLPGPDMALALIVVFQLPSPQGVCPGQPLDSKRAKAGSGPAVQGQTTTCPASSRTIRSMRAARSRLCVAISADRPVSRTTAISAANT